MQLNSFIFITRDDWPEVEQCILSFGEHHTLSIIRFKDSGTHEVEFEESGYTKNPFDKHCTGNIQNISLQQINNYILLLSILTGSPPIQV